MLELVHFLVYDHRLFPGNDWNSLAAVWNQVNRGSLPLVAAEPWNRFLSLMSWKFPLQTASAANLPFHTAQSVWTWGNRGPIRSLAGNKGSV